VLVNRTGVDLANVYFVFNYPQTESSPEGDWILYYPEWPQGKALDIGYEFNNKETATLTVHNATVQMGLTATPTDGKKRVIKGTINSLSGQQGGNDWATWWFGGLKSSAVSDQFDDSKNDYIRSFPMLSLFDRIRPQENTPAMGGFNSDRVEVVRRAAREFDLSGMVASGQLVILATSGKPGAVAGSPLPFPLDVQGDRVTGTGTTFYQFALPLARNELPPPWAKPDDTAATQPTTAPATPSAPAGPASK
jgi:hypothetical protein